ncbi:MAG: hypothetical protein ABDH31_02345 [Chlorobiota bacterium]
MSSLVPRQLVAFFQQAYAERAHLIEQRLEEFAAVGQQPEATFYELCYCLCTPLTKASHAIAAIEKLRRCDFYRYPLPLEDIEGLLRDPSHYIRFHRTKACRLLLAHRLFPKLWELRHTPQPATVLRRQLVAEVPGFGMKEASHFLRNTGERHLAVLDRHVVRWMRRLGYTVRLSGSVKGYEQAEGLFCRIAFELGFLPAALDLLWWSLETGEVLR